MNFVSSESCSEVGRGVVLKRQLGRKDFLSGDVFIIFIPSLSKRGSFEFKFSEFGITSNEIRVNRHRQKWKYRKTKIVGGADELRILKRR